MSEQRYTLTLRPIRDPLGRQPAQRIKGALKVLLRQFGLRCVKITEAQGNDQTDSSSKVKP